MKRICLAILAITVSWPACAGDVKPLAKLSAAEMRARFQGDAQAVQLHRRGLLEVIDYQKAHPELFPVSRPAERRLLRREEKEQVWAAWQRFMDYLLALGSTEKYHAGFYRLKPSYREDSFVIACAAMAARYRASLEFIERIEKNPELPKVLNDAVPELGLPADTYSRLKFQILNVAMASEFAAREVLLKTFSDGQQPELRKLIAQDASRILAYGRSSGPVLTARNALKVVREKAESAWLPVQSGVAEWMGDTKVYRPKESLMAPGQIAGLRTQLQPGDILLERRDWYLSNIGLPGFWPHAALYLGTPTERRAFFEDPAVQEWAKAQGQADGSFEALLEKRYPAAYRKACVECEDRHPARLIEAMSEGVCFTSLEHSADCDSLAVLRPRLSKLTRARALLRAFHFAGRPYDFNFDFATDAELVCTELVYKAFTPDLNFPLIEMLGRKVMPANEMVKHFDASYGTPAQQYDLVAFLDGSERQKRTVTASVGEFRKSWQRPKWHVVTRK